MDLLRRFSIWKTRIFPEAAGPVPSTRVPHEQRPGRGLPGLPDWTVSFMGANIEKIVGYSSEEFTSRSKTVG